MIKLLVANETEIQDITYLVTQIDWSGSYKSAARSLEFEIVAYASDDAIPTANIELGNAVSFMDGDTVLFEGYIVNRRKVTNGNSISVRCYDRGLYLKGNTAIYQFKNTTPESAARKVCEDFGIPVGEIAETGISLTHNFIGKRLYDIIIGMYTMASEQSEDKYIVVFKGGKLCVLKKELGEDTLVIKGGSNLMNLSVSESIENLTNQVVIYEKDYKTVGTHNDENSIRLYGLFQSMIRNGDDAEKRAKHMLRDDAEPTQKITVNTLGDTRSVTGNMVMLEEPYTGLWGLFYIDEDNHTWKKGQYYNKLVLNLKNIMDEKEVAETGKDDVKTNIGTTGKTAPAHIDGVWQYLYSD